MRRFIMICCIIILLCTGAAISRSVEYAAEKKSTIKSEDVTKSHTDSERKVDNAGDRDVLIIRKHADGSDDETTVYVKKTDDPSVMYTGKLYAEAPNELVRGREMYDMPPFPDFDGDGPHSFKARLMIMYRLIDQLDMNEETATEFFPLYLAYINSRDKLMSEHRNLIREVISGVEDKSVPISELQKKVAQVMEKEKQIDDHRKSFLKKAEDILDDRQYIKLVIFNDKLKEDLILQFRRRSDRDSRDWRERQSGEGTDNNESNIKK